MKRPGGFTVSGLGLSLCCLALWNCAHVEAPPGGPPDKLPPYVAGVFPAPEQTQVDREAKIRLQFSEWIKSDLTADRIVLNPALPGKLRLDVDGTLLTLAHDSLFRANTTYGLYFPNAVQDMAGLSMDSSFRLAFSTGPSLDSAVLSGRLFLSAGKPVKDAWVGLYPRLREAAIPRRGQRRKMPWPDSIPNPWREKPLYLEPCDSLGRFDFRNLTPGHYGVLGFIDANHNHLPDAGENIAVGPAGIRVGPSAPPSLVMRLGDSDTSSLKLVQTTWVPAGMPGPKSKRVSGALRLKFNRNLAWPQASEPRFYRMWPLGDSASFRPVSVDLNPDRELELWLKDLETSQRYGLSLNGLKDEAGGALDTSRANATFEVTPPTDSTPMAFSLWLRPDLVGPPVKAGAEPMVGMREVLVRASQPLPDSAFEQLAGRWKVRLDSVPLTAKAERAGAFSIRLSWPAPKDSGKAIDIGMQGIRLPTDTSTASPPVQPVGRLNLLKPSQWAKLTLQVDAAILGWTAELKRIKGPESRVFRLSQSQSVLDSLAPGIWTLAFFADQNGDGHWFPGKAFPWSSQEPASNWPDTLDLQANNPGRSLKLDGR